VGRSERLFKPRDSWFSSKCIEVQRRVLMSGGRALKGLGGIPVYQTLSNSEYHSMEHGSETAGDKLRRQKGNNPDQQLRCLNNAKWKGCGISQTVRMLA
jgi:hypothetical protein